MTYRSQSLAKDSQFKSKRIQSALAMGLLGTVVLGRIGYLALAQHEQHAERAERNTQSTIRLEAPRGNILDRESRPLAYNEDSFRITFLRRGLTQDEIRSTLLKIGQLWQVDMSEKIDEVLASKDPWKEHLLANKKTLDEIIALQETPENFPGARLHRTPKRIYPYGYSTAHIIGTIGSIQKSQVQEYTRPLYLPDALVGQSGLEAFYEPRLVGKRGVLQKKVNARREQLAEPQLLEGAKPGDDLHLTINAEWQQYACDLLGERKGSIIFIDVTNGEIVVLASMPTYDPASPGKSTLDGLEVSYFNRSVQGLYPPGSTFKLVTATAVLEHSTASLSTTVNCEGYYRWPGWSRRFHCDNRSGHGPIALEDALKVSCNVYFYKNAELLGGELMANAATDFGFGRKTGIDLSTEKSGSLQNNRPAPEGPEILNFGIGQGQILSTPLQVATSFAYLANNGAPLRPHLVANQSTGQITEPHPLPRWSTQGRTAIINGFWKAVNESGGTAYRSGFEREWDVIGKTGTAEKGGDKLDAWFAGFYPRSRPKYAFVAHIEDANDHGGTVAAPLIREMIRKIESPAEAETKLAAE
ncbi:MAG: penicillin-binding transpeptidase domain-containing protein [Sumerlaeia bacterium]